MAVLLQGSSRTEISSLSEETCRVYMVQSVEGLIGIHARATGQVKNFLGMIVLIARLRASAALSGA